MYKVDIIIPTFKRPTFLRRAISSVLSQTYKNVNVIVVDDNNASDTFREKTQNVMNEFTSNDRVTYLQHEFNRNGAAARNTGIRNSSADFIGFLDDDDFFLPDKIKHQMEVLDNSDAKWGGACCYHVRRYRKYAYTAYEIKKKSEGNYCFEFLSGTISIPSSTLLIKSEVFSKVGLFDESFERHQDFEFIVRFFRKYKMAVSPYFDLFMQMEGFRNFPNSKRAHKTKDKFLNKYKLDIESFSETEQQVIYKFQWFAIACLHLRDRRFRESMQLFREQVFKNKRVKLNDLFKIMFFLLWGYIPLLKKCAIFVLGLTKYRHFSGKII